MEQPNYRHDENKQKLRQISRYITPDEWRELSSVVNDAARKYHLCNNCFAMTTYILTLGVCFCPLCWVGCKMKKNVNKDLAAAPIAAALGQRGIGLEWVPRTDWDAGELLCRRANTPSLRCLNSHHAKHRRPLVRDQSQFSYGQSI